MVDGKRKAEGEAAEAAPAKKASGPKPPAGVNPKRVRELRPGAVQKGPVIYWQVINYSCDVQGYVVG